MFQSAQMVSYRVPDLEQAKQWYRALLNQEPSFDSPLAVVFTVGSSILTLVPAADPPREDERCVAFWKVDDIEAAYQRLLASGALARAEIALLMLRSRVAKVVDPFGNVVGLMSTSDPQRSVDERPSESALTVAFCRALAYHETRAELRGPDSLAEIFLSEEGQRPLRDAAARAWLVEKFSGTYGYFFARTAYLDQVVQAALRQGVPQIVFLGAGYDTRAYRFADLIGTTRIFELDSAATQRRKRQMLQQAAVAVPAQVAYVSINFEKEKLAEVLDRAGFDKSQRTLFMWEGVTYYLTAQIVDDTLAFVRHHAAAGSTIAFDYQVQAPDMASRPGAQAVLDAWRQAYSSEPVRFGIDEGTLAAFLSSRGYRLLEHLSAEELERRYLTLRDGTLGAKVVALFALAQAKVSA
jgi:methyltransferase (TIGR00027 family)